MMIIIFKGEITRQMSYKINKFDHIVLGLGAMGSSTVYHLAKKNSKVLGIEQFKVSHNLGSSHGHSRIIRMAYFESPAYVDMLRYFIFLLIDILLNTWNSYN